MMNGRRLLLTSTSRYKYLADSILTLAGSGFLTPLRMTREVKPGVERFPDGERYHRLEENIAGADIVIVGGTITDEETMELFDMAQMMVRYKAHSIQLIIPYFGYSTMERAVKYGEDVKAKNRALLFSYIPKPPAGITVVMLDLHAEGIKDYFENGVYTEHLYAQKLILKAINDVRGKSKIVVGSTDAGRLKWIDSYAKILGCGVGTVLKRRLSGDKTELVAASASVRSKHVIVFDDMARTCGSLVTACKVYRKKGCKELTVIVTHGPLPGDSLDKLFNEVDEKTGGPLVDRFIVTDSHPRVKELQALDPDGKRLIVVSVAQLLLDYLLSGTNSY